MNKQQLANRIWESANRMRSKIEANEYKDYILGFIFYKYLSDTEVEWLKENDFTDEDIRTLADFETVKYVQDNLGYFISYENLYSTWINMGNDFSVSNVTDALSAFSRLISPTHKPVFENIFRTLETGLSKLGDTSGARTKAIRGLLQLIRDIPMDGRQDYDVLGFIYEYLIEKNKFMNLTGITDFEEVLTKHFLDSLSCVKSIDMTKVKTMIDIGTGAGFPGVPLKIAFPHLQACLLDSLKKRVNFLEESFQLLGLTDITAIHGRAEEYARNKEYREQYDLCVSRAVSNLATLSEYCLPYVKKGGSFISYKSGTVQEETRQAEKAIKILGGDLQEITYFNLPDTEISRSLIPVKKIKSTPKAYPRKAGTPLKTPLS